VPCLTTQDDPDDATDSHGRFLSFRHPDVSSEEHNLTVASVSPNLTMDDASRYVLTHTPSNFQRMIETNYSYGFETDPKQLAENDKIHSKVRPGRPRWCGYRNIERLI
jgi:phospholipid:diacylglycerol acyltransferase